jgi:NAD(P)-dependent dehydrogenase (short-subunit alcohol dehydrogenase family)
MSTLDGKVAIVTGGAGGLGAAVVTTFLGAGARVIVPVERDSDLDTLRERAHIPASAPLRAPRETETTCDTPGSGMVTPYRE